MKEKETGKSELKKDREIAILKAIFSNWGEYRAIETEERIANFKWECLQVYLEGLEKIIQNEKLDQWLLVVGEIARRKITGIGTWKSEEERVIISTLELWYQILWMDCNSEDRLVVLEGLEIQIEENNWNEKLLAIIDYLRRAVEESITLHIQMKNDREREIKRRLEDDIR